MSDRSSMWNTGRIAVGISSGTTTITNNSIGSYNEVRYNARCNHCGSMHSQYGSPVNRSCVRCGMHVGGYNSEFDQYKTPYDTYAVPQGSGLASMIQMPKKRNKLLTLV